MISHHKNWNALSDCLSSDGKCEIYVCLQFKKKLPAQKQFLCLSENLPPPSFKRKVSSSVPSQASIDILFSCSSVASTYCLVWVLFVVEFKKLWTKMHLKLANKLFTFIVDVLGSRRVKEYHLKFAQTVQ